MKEMTIQISGMRCGGCASGVEQAINRMNGIQRVHVDVAKKEAVVTFDHTVVLVEQIKDTIQKIGYEVVGYYENR